jgi:hypothetical protein
MCPPGFIAYLAVTMNRKKEPLYRKENKVSLSTKYYVRTGGEYRHQRHTKAALADERTHQSMNSGKYGYDYTPLFRFLLSKVGQDWDEVFSEAKSRLDKTEPVFWMVALHEHERREVVRLGESSYFSGLYVDDEGLLQKVNPELETFDPGFIYPGETISFNGKAIQPETN